MAVVVPVRAQGDGPDVRRRLYAGAAARQRQHADRDHRAGGADASSCARRRSPLTMPRAAGARSSLLHAGDVRLSGRRPVSAIATGRHPDITGSVAAKTRREASRRRRSQPANKEPAEPVGAESSPPRHRGGDGPAARPRRLPSARCWSGCRSAARSSRRAAASSSFAKAWSRPRKRSWRQVAAAEADKAAQGASGHAGDEPERTAQGRRHHVRDDEAEGRGEDLRPARSQGAVWRWRARSSRSGCRRSWR